MTQTQKIPLSVMLITKNEEKNIEDCLKTVSWASDIIVLDDESTDQTKTLAQKYTNRIYSRKMDNEGRHRNYGYNLAKEDWVLSIDADERITPDLARKIQKTIQTSTSHNGFAIPRKNYIGKYWEMKRHP